MHRNMCKRYVENLVKDSRTPARFAKILDYMRRDVITTIQTGDHEKDTWFDELITDVEITRPRELPQVKSKTENAENPIKV